MKILILANNDIGLYNFRFELIEELINHGHNVIISLPNGDKVKDLVSIGCHFIDTPIDRHGMNPLSEIKLINTYKNIIKTNNPDVILGYTIKPNIYGAIVAKSFKKPFIANITGLGTAVEYKSWKQPILINLYKFAFKNVYKVFFQNTSNCEFFVNNKIITSKYEILPGSGVNLEKFSYETFPSEEIVKFSFISRIMKEKGIDQYLAAAEYVRSKYPKTEFNIYGFCEQEYENILEDLQNKKIVNYHGLVNNIPLVLSNTHCLIHPTYYPEGMSNVLLEAAATGRPAITTNRSGCREIVDDTLTGFIIEEQNTKDLIEKIEIFLNLTTLEKSNMGKHAREKVEREFNRNIVIRKYNHAIDSIEKKK
ncbi:glycosyltransferase family 4 protein [Streptococcus parauberis]|nr:glycosyltransferase family 4 protein [Streptococcus parauberis]UWM91927.1 glycosyltransferase family 4 protein [Streptococcus parauberis]GAJ61751.1 glycosyl transferase family protein [Streptococcus parauberis]